MLVYLRWTLVLSTPPSFDYMFISPWVWCMAYVQTGVPVLLANDGRSDDGETLKSSGNDVSYWQPSGPAERAANKIMVVRMLTQEFAIEIEVPHGPPCDITEGH